jgi:hypothetical protein
MTYLVHKPTAAIALFASMTLLMTACGQTISDDSKTQLSKEVDCTTAEQDVAALEKQRASTLNRISTGAQYVVPIAVVVNIFRSYNQDGTSEEFYNDREQVLTGEYNDSIAAKIEEIQSVCDLPGG